ncbi:peptidoglycan DD-metalloendopeptidase family protein [Micrococcus luteus]
MDTAHTASHDRRPRSRLLASLAAGALLLGAPASAAPDAEPTPIPAGLHWASPAPGAGPGDLLRAFDAPERPWDAGHRGVDLRLSGGVVVAPADGTVRHVGTVAGRPVLSIDHGQDVVSSMEPVTAVVEEGERVRAGQPIGRLGPEAAHCAEPCVHLGVRVLDGWPVGGTLRDRYLDPALLLGLSGPSVLWPLEGARADRPEDEG